MSYPADILHAEVAEMFAEMSECVLHTVTLTEADLCEESLSVLVLPAVLRRRHADGFPKNIDQQPHGRGEHAIAVGAGLALALHGRAPFLPRPLDHAQQHGLVVVGHVETLERNGQRC